MRRDIDLIIDRLRAEVPGIRIEQLKVTHPGADDDGLWFINIPDQQGEVQLESSEGMCPFLIESNFNDVRYHGYTVEEVVATVKRLHSSLGYDTQEDFRMSKALRVLITGAARGIGMATAQALANRGHSVVATDVSPLSGSEGIQAHVLDVTSDDSVARCLEEVGPLDAIVNNAAITSGGGPVEGYPLDRIRQMIETNTLGALRMIQAVLPAWRKRGSGVIVNVSSVNGRVSAPLRAAYSASKFALEAITESLHLEVRHFGIRCVLIEPGTIATGIKPIEPHKGPADYAGLWEQWAGANTRMTGSSGPPGPEVVALAIARAIEDPATPFRVPVGQDAEMILGLRRSLDDQAFEDAMRKAVGLTW